MKRLFCCVFLRCCIGVFVVWFSFFVLDSGESPFCRKGSQNLLPYCNCNFFGKCYGVTILKIILIFGIFIIIVAKVAARIAIGLLCRLVGVSGSFLGAALLALRF